MPNLTISIDEQLIKQARKRVAQLGTSVSAKHCATNSTKAIFAPRAVPAFFDTNVLVCCTDTGNPQKQAAARELVVQASQSASGVLSTQVLRP